MGLVRGHREVLLHQLCSYFLKMCEGKKRILPRLHGEVLKSIMEGLRGSYGSGVMPDFEVVPCLGRGVGALKSALSALNFSADRKN